MSLRSIAVRRGGGRHQLGQPAHPQHDRRLRHLRIRRCPPGTDLLGGGSCANAPPGTSQPTPFHLDGNYPSDGSGNPVTMPSSVDSWSVVSETGAGFPGATTSVYAICGS